MFWKHSIWVAILESIYDLERGEMKRTKPDVESQSGANFTAVKCLYSGSVILILLLSSSYQLSSTIIHHILCMLYLTPVGWIEATGPARI